MTIFWILSCTSPAEHSNPLDPQSPKYTTTGEIIGRVTGYYQPFRPLAGAMIRLQPPGVVIESGQDGGFRFAGLAPQTYSLEVSRPDYAADSLNIDLLSRQTAVLEFHLDGLPQIQFAFATSAHISTRESAADRYFFEIVADASDPDGANDIKRMRVEIPALAFADTLLRAAGPTRWRRLFAPDDLAGSDLNNLAGTPLQIIAEDFPGEAATSEPFFLARVIAEVPQTVSPDNGEAITDPSPRFVWQTPAIQFNHTFRVEVFRIDAGFPTFIAAIGNIEAGTASVTYVGRLSTGTYFWTVKIIDDFGNSSRSKEATFQVE